MTEQIDGDQLAAWALSRVEKMCTPIGRAIYAGLATRATRPGGFDVRANTSNMDDTAAGTADDKEKKP